MKTLKFLLLLGLLNLPTLGECQITDSYFPFNVEINYLGGTIRQETTINSKELFILNSGDSVLVLELKIYPFFKVKYQDIIGYISASSFTINKSFEKVKVEIEKVQLSEKRKEIEANNKRLLMKDLIGKTAPMFKLKDINGKEFEFTGNNGKFILLEFWAEGCGHCITVARELEKYADYLKKNNTELIIVESSKEKASDRVRSIIEKYKVNEKTLYGGKEVSEIYGVKAFPSFFLINNKGEIIFSHVGSNLLEFPIKDDLLNLIEKP
jgi:thiol-disulfide isomerase/thioredoxin